MSFLRDSRQDPVEDWGRFEFLRDDAGSPLGHGYPSGSPLREDGETHREAWMRILRADPCAYCDRSGGSVDHVEPRSRPARGLGGAHSWANYVGACDACNSRKSDKRLLLWMLSRRGVSIKPRPQPKPRAPKVISPRVEAPVSDRWWIKQQYRRSGAMR